MVIDTDAIQNLGTAVASILTGGYVAKEIWNGYQSFKKDVYSKLEKKVEISLCDGFRETEKEARERVDQDLQQHKEGVK